MGATHVVGISDCKVSGDATDTVVTYALGSCVGLALYDPRSRVGGILHLMLPDSRYRSSSRDFNAFMFADSGFHRFLELLTSLGAHRHRLTAKVAGGANMLKQSSLLDIGKRNAEAVLEILNTEKIPIRGQSLGGNMGRSMQLRLEDGSVLVKILGAGEEVL